MFFFVFFHANKRLVCPSRRSSLVPECVSSAYLTPPQQLCFFLPLANELVVGVVARAPKMSGNILKEKTCLLKKKIVNEPK